MKRPTTAPAPAAIEIDIASGDVGAGEPEPITCPKCGYSSPDSDFTPRPLRVGLSTAATTYDGVDICLNCGEFMAFDEALDNVEAQVLGTRTPTPVLATSMDFARYSPETCRKLLESQSITAKLARMRGYHLGRLKFRKGTA